MSEKVGSIHYEVTLDTAQMVAGQRRADKALSETQKSLDGVEKKLNQVAQAVASYAAALYLIRQSDAFTKMNAQLKLATESTRELAVAQADVKKIAQEAQTDIGAVASLYAKVSSSTRELGIAQAQVSDITRSVSLALKVSGASAAESSAAILQLGQAFASGVLRGDEFNSVAEAAPRLMKALADGVGVPVGQLRAMAEQGKLTSDVLATALPKALKDLESEAQQIQTISGAFQELRNEVMLFVGEQTAANGVVAVLTGGIGLLKDSLGLLAGIMATVAAVKFANWLQAMVAETYAAVAANVALKSANLATAQANAAATAATVALTAARVAELRGSVMAAEGATALAIVTNGLIPAQTRAAAAAEAHAASLVALSAAQRSASVTGNLASGALGLLGGPIGLITTLLGLGATAWALWGSSAAEGEKKATAQVEASTEEIVASLEKQIAKLKERNKLAETGMVGLAKGDTDAAKKMASLLTQINDLKAGKGINGGAPLPEAARQGLLQNLLKQYASLQVAVEGVANEQEKLDSAGKQSKASEWLAKYATDAERLAAELKKAKAELGGAFTPEIKKRITEKYTPKKTATAKTEKTPFDTEGYMAGLRKAQASEIGVINETEAEKLRIAKRNLAEKKITETQYAEAVKLIQTAAEDDRVELMRKTQERIDKDREESDKKEQDAIKKKKELQKEAIDYAAGLTKAVNPIDALRQEYQAKLEIVTQYEQMMAQAGVDATAQGQLTRTQITNEYELQRRALAEQSYRSQGEAQAFLLDSLQSLSSTATSSIVGLLDGTTTAQGAMRALGQTITNEAIGALVQMGVQQIKNALISDSIKAADAAKSAAMGAVYAASVSAQVTGMAAMAAQNAFAATAAIPIIGPGLAPAAAAAAGATASALGAPAIATAPIAGARQYGGPVSSGSMYRVNETGAPEMFTANNGNQYMLPTKSGSVTSADKVGGGGVSVVVNVDAGGSSVEGSGEQSKQLGAMIGNAVRAVLIQEKRNGGLLA
jgi:tape measure domain-containing protein